MRARLGVMQTRVCVCAGAHVHTEIITAMKNKGYSLQENNGKANKNRANEMRKELSSTPK